MTPLTQVISPDSSCAEGKKKLNQIWYKDNSTPLAWILDWVPWGMLTKRLAPFLSIVSFESHRDQSVRFC